MEAALRERQPLDVEAQQARAGLAVPAEPGGIGGAACDEQARVVTELVGEPRRRDRARGGDAQPDGERLAAEELLPALALWAEQDGLLDAGLTAAPLAEAGAA